MADSLFSILNGKNFDEPPEVRAIKEYVRRHYDSEVNITMQPHSIVIAARSAGLIGSLRMNLPKLQAAATTEKRIIFRVG
jgi:ABC-type hemin transport system substrate-binding protein